MSKLAPAPTHVVLTGVTGFVGKVVLHDLLARRDELNLASVTVLIRPAKARDGRVILPSERFQESARSAAFHGLAPGWEKLVEVVAADLSEPECALSAADIDDIAVRTTHVIHCAASVDFDLPVAQAALANVTSALNVLELARRCPRLKIMVDVSTAYVTPWQSGPIAEILAPLPRSAAAMHEEIVTHARAEADLLAETGHPNTYTYTKCLAEHLLCERRGAVPLAIVRPSIISAAWQSPVPGWLDSTAAFAGCLLYAGLGIVRAWEADPQVRLDVVPVDLVSRQIMRSAFDEDLAHFVATPEAPVPIRYAVSGLERSVRVDLAVQTTINFFRDRPGIKAVPSMFIGRREHGFARADLLRREVPLQLRRAFLRVTKRHQDLKRLERADEKVRYMNEVFAYFTHKTFDFRPSSPDAALNYTPGAYVDLVVRGIYRHLLRVDETELSLAGGGHDDARRDLRWLREKSRHDWAVDALALGVRKVLRRCTSKVTFDRPSFERALALLPADAVVVLAPSHRSYLDFLITSFLCYQQPELGLRLPQIAAAQEFSQIPFVGDWLQQCGAFYIPRGVGKASPEVNAKLNELAQQQAPLMFFIEGQRSRSRHTLAPKRGILRGLQSTGKTFVLLPIAVSYDRLPEEGAFDRELAGGARSKMSLSAVIAWLAKLTQDGAIALGRVHVACGQPVLLDPSVDVVACAHDVLMEQQRQTVATSFHLRTFLQESGLAGIDEPWLRQAIEDRGGRIIASDLPVRPGLSPHLTQSLRNQWMPWFCNDAVRRYPQHPVVDDHMQRRCWLPSGDAPEGDPRLHALIDALFTPVARDYAACAHALASERQNASLPAPRELIKRLPQAHLPHVEDAYAALVERQILGQEGERYTWGPARHELESFARACVLEPAPSPTSVRSRKEGRASSAVASGFAEIHP